MSLGTLENEQSTPHCARTSWSPSATTAPRSALKATALAFTGALVPVLAWLPMRPAPGAVAVYLTGAAGLVAVASGAIWFAPRRLRSRLADGRFASAWIIVGALLLAHAGVTSRTGGAAPTASALDQLVVVAMAAWLLGRTSTSAAAKWAHVSLRALGVTVAAGSVLMLVAHLLETFAVPSTWEATWAWRAVPDIIAGAAWLVLAVGCVRRTRRQDSQDSHVPGMPVALALMGIAALVRVPAPATPSFQLVSSALVLLAAAVFFGPALMSLRGILSERTEEELPLHPTRAVHARSPIVERDHLDEWLHDVRNAVSGLRAADAVLREEGDQRLEKRAEVAQAVSAELARLHDLVEARAPSGVHEVALADVLERAAAVERLYGVEVHVAVGALTVHAEPSALERAVRNVLANARAHAPGSPVHVRATERDGVVSLLLRDEGPGVPPDQRLAVFGRGRRGPDAEKTPGSGLGLYVTRQLVQAMGGDVRIAPESQKGCCVEITLPRAGTAELVHPA